MQLSPMMQQYMDIKGQHKDCILFFRLGDFYEMFFEDAITASRQLELTLTGKNCGQEERAPMCGVPFHSADTYIARLVEKGYKVAICEQVEEPASAKGLVKREVVQIVTPGTVINQSMLNEKENNYLASVFVDQDRIGIAYCDISTGEICGTSFSMLNGVETLSNELVKIRAKEVLLNAEAEAAFSISDMETLFDSYFNVLPDNYYSAIQAEETVMRQFQVQSLVGLGLGENECAVKALGALLLYLIETQKRNLSHLSRLKFYEIGKHMSLDKATIRNLELTETLYDKRVQGSLLGILDKTHTAMGGRKLKQWLREPLNTCCEIKERLDAVESLTDDLILRNNLKESLKRIYDLERLAGRVACGNANGKDLIALRNSVYVLPEIKSDLVTLQKGLLEQLESEISALGEVHALIHSSIAEDPPFTIKEGGIIKEGYSKELDNLKLSIRDAQNWIAQLESKERARTGIKNLKVGFNKVFGYYLEITKSYYELTPDNYIRKQTLANCERFITPELKEMESLVLNAETKINQMEYELFTEIRKKLQNHIAEIQSTADAVAVLDVLVSFAETSTKLGYIKPLMHEGGEISIEKGRHAVIEQTMNEGVFVSNDLYIDTKDNALLLITGPNMAGKSTYMRQTALIVLMAQAGCFVPCEKASIGVVDRIFTRIGASDNLAQGQSTFFVEMSELAYILNTSSDRSLIILDEIGRGTSTYDGLSIAWAAAEYLCRGESRRRTLFATHYHELTVLEGMMKGVKNLNVDVAEQNGNIVFLHKIVEGSASRSYGIHVAKLAGVPPAILDRAAEKLLELEQGAVCLDEGGYMQVEAASGKEVVQNNEQISFFSALPNPVVDKLRALDLMEIRPSEAFKILEELKEAADD